MRFPFSFRLAPKINLCHRKVKISQKVHRIFICIKQFYCAEKGYKCHKVNILNILSGIQQRNVEQILLKSMVITKKH